MKVTNINRSLVSLLVSISILTCRALGQDVDDSCAVVDTVENFDIETYASAKWYSHKQAENGYQSLDDFYCVTAEYNVRSRKTFWGYFTYN